MQERSDDSSLVPAKASKREHRTRGRSSHQAKRKASTINVTEFFSECRKLEKISQTLNMEFQFSVIEQNENSTNYVMNK